MNVCGKYEFWSWTIRPSAGSPSAIPVGGATRFVCIRARSAQGYIRTRRHLSQTGFMPDLWLDCCQHIRADKTSTYTYVILMTATRERRSRKRTRSSPTIICEPFDSKKCSPRRWRRRIIDLHRQLERESGELEAAARTDSLTGLPEPPRD